MLDNSQCIAIAGFGHVVDVKFGQVMSLVKSQVKGIEQPLNIAHVVDMLIHIHIAVSYLDGLLELAIG